MASTRDVEPSSSSQQGNAPAPGAQVPESLWTNAFWHCPLRNAYDHHQLVFVLQCFENVSNVFGPNWYKMANRSGRFRPFDMNIPYKFPGMSVNTGEFDPPLTDYGKFCANAVARSLRNQLFKIPIIISAPSVRCFQTALIISRVMETKVYVLEELREPEIVTQYGCQITAYGKYLDLKKLRTIDGGSNVQGLKLENDIPSSETDSELEIMSRIGTALRQLTGKIKSGPMLIVGDALVLKLANSISALPEGYSDPMQDVPFTVPPLDGSEDAVEMDRYDFTLLPECFPPGTLNVFHRETENDIMMRIPYAMPKLTIVPPSQQKENLLDLKADKPENVLSIQRPADAAEPHAGNSEVSLNI